MSTIQEERERLLFEEALDSDPEVIAAASALTAAARKLAEAGDAFNKNHPQAGMFLPADGRGIHPADLALARVQSGIALRALRAANEEHSAADRNHRRIVAEVRRRLILDSGKETNNGNGK